MASALARGSTSAVPVSRAGQIAPLILGLVLEGGPNPVANSRLVRGCCSLFHAVSTQRETAKLFRCLIVDPQEDEIESARAHAELFTSRRTAARN
jgi:hypothetical protein